MCLFERFSQKPKQKFIFVHVPKCGGTSVEKLIKKSKAYKCSESEFEPNIKFRHAVNTLNKKELLNDRNKPSYDSIIQTIFLYKLQCGTPVLFGHFPVSKSLVNSYIEEYDFVTLLREPCERWISNYIYSQIRDSQKGKRKKPQSLKQELLNYISSQEAAVQGSIYSYYFGNGNLETNSGIKVDQAISTLEKFKIVGFLDELSDFTNNLASYLNISKIYLRELHERRTIELIDPIGYSFKDYKAIFNDGILSKIEAICQPDIEVFQACREQRLNLR